MSQPCLLARPKVPRPEWLTSLGDVGPGRPLLHGRHRPAQEEPTLPPATRRVNRAPTHTGLCGVSIASFAAAEQMPCPLRPTENAATAGESDAEGPNRADLARSAEPPDLLSGRRKRVGERGGHPCPRVAH